MQFSQFLLHEFYENSVIYFFNSFVFGPAGGIWEFPGQGSNPHIHSNQSHYSENRGSLTHCTTGELPLLMFWPVLSALVPPDSQCHHVNSGSLVASRSAPSACVGAWTFSQGSELGCCFRLTSCVFREHCPSLPEAPGLEKHLLCILFVFLLLVSGRKGILHMFLCLGEEQMAGGRGHRLCTVYSVLLPSLLRASGSAFISQCGHLLLGESSLDPVYIQLRYWSWTSLVLEYLSEFFFVCLSLLLDLKLNKSQGSCVFYLQSLFACFHIIDIQYVLSHVMDEWLYKAPHPLSTRIAHVFCFCFSFLPNAGSLSLGAVFAYKRLLELKNNRCELLKAKVKNMESTISGLQKELSETKEVKSQLEHQMAEWQGELCSLRYWASWFYHLTVFMMQL